jgi:cysteinyl-tRNA synthetase
MTLSVTNTLTGEREAFEPGGEEVLLYVCGLTVSDDAHLGHARVWTHADVMHRWLDHCGYDVRHVENFTDVNEKIVARVGEDGESEADVAAHYVQQVILNNPFSNFSFIVLGGHSSVCHDRGSHPGIVEMVDHVLDEGVVGVIGWRHPVFETRIVVCNLILAPLAHIEWRIGEDIVCFKTFVLVVEDTVSLFDISI